MVFYLTGEPTTTTGKRVSDSQVRYHTMNLGYVFVHPEAIKNGTVHPDDFPGVELVITDTPPPDALILAPGPRGWVIK